jgi:predicted nucleic acid-binding protein
VASYFVDSSALAKRYVLEVGSGWLRAALEPATGCRTVVARATPVELVSAIARRERGGGLTAADAAAARADLLLDLVSEYRVVEFGESVALEAMDLAVRHVLRGYDAIQLASALEANRAAVAAGLPPMVFISSDAALNAAARQEGLPVEDPNRHP